MTDGNTASLAHINIDGQCLELGKILGLQGPVSQEVLLAALGNGAYAHNLLTCRRTPEFLNHLLSNPPKAYAGVETGDEKLIARAELALQKWSETGFSLVDDEILKRREEACVSCPNLGELGQQFRQSHSSGNQSDKLGERTGDRICKICGCNASGKMRRTSASCPDKHPTEAGMTRWQEPLESPVKTK
jgi:hypothetical protein